LQNPKANGTVSVREELGLRLLALEALPRNGIPTKTSIAHVISASPQTETISSPETTGSQIQCQLMPLPKPRVKAKSNPIWTDR
jgi:hypothetical protein